MKLAVRNDKSTCNTLLTAWHPTFRSSCLNDEQSEKLGGEEAFCW